MEYTLFYWLYDVIVNQYLIATGEFVFIDNYAAGQQPNLAVLLFVGAIFFSQITMLNMLIAIMSDVFENQTEKRYVMQIRTKLQILAEQAPLLSKISKTDEQNVFMIVIEAIKDEDFEYDTW